MVVMTQMVRKALRGDEIAKPHGLIIHLACAIMVMMMVMGEPPTINAEGVSRRETNGHNVILNEYPAQKLPNRNSRALVNFSNQWIIAEFPCNRDNSGASHHVSGSLCWLVDIGRLYSLWKMCQTTVPQPLQPTRGLP
jgi:hypothetical protein